MVNSAVVQAAAVPPTDGVFRPPPTLAVKFVSAGLAACVADIVTFPLDTAKVRLQIQGEKAVPLAAGGLTQAIASDSSSKPAFKYRGIFRTIGIISREEGVTALYNGLAAGLQRQLCFASIRIGFYDSVKQKYIDFFYGDTYTNGTNVGLRIMAGITTGGFAVACAQPTDVVKIRMQAQTAGKRCYTGCIHAYKSIAAEEGIINGLWRGVLPNITRNAIMNAAELVSYDLLKESILRHRLLTDNMPCHFVSAFGAGFCATVVASPVDVVKTRYMNSTRGVYSGALNCAYTMFKEGGLFAFYKGFVPSFVRVGSWNIAMFVTFEQLKRFFVRVFY